MATLRIQPWSASCVAYCSNPNNAFGCTPAEVSGGLLYFGGDFGILPFNAVAHNALTQLDYFRSVGVSSYNALQLKAHASLAPRPRGRRSLHLVARARRQQRSPGSGTGESHLSPQLAQPVAGLGQFGQRRAPYRGDQLCLAAAPRTGRELPEPRRAGADPRRHFCLRNLEPGDGTPVRSGEQHR